MSKKFTMRDVVEAIRKDGLPKYRGAFFDWKYGDDEMPVIVGGCALGQAALNLDVDADQLWRVLPMTFRRAVTHMNDFSDRSLPEIADAVASESNLDTVIIVSDLTEYGAPYKRPIVEQHDAP
jgi:hypothetical protein